MQIPAECISQQASTGRMISEKGLFGDSCEPAGETEGCLGILHFGQYSGAQVGKEIDECWNWKRQRSL